MVQPKKHLGQHFLTDKNIARKIVESLSGECKNILEIGPGTGVLTQILLTKEIANYSVIEIDKESITFLQKQYPEISERIIDGDFLRYDLNRIFDGKFSIIGNFPYNISSQILFKILENRKNVTEVVGMFQKEVAERIASPAGNKKYGILSVLVQAYYTIEYLFTVNENVFYPPPKVKSAVIRLIRNNTETLACNEKLFFEVVKAGFNQRRKTLRNSLRKFHFHQDEKVLEMLTKRAEQLNVDDFVFLTRNINTNT